MEGHNDCKKGDEVDLGALRVIFPSDAPDAAVAGILIPRPTMPILCHLADQYSAATIPPPLSVRCKSIALENS